VRPEVIRELVMRLLLKSSARFLKLQSEAKSPRMRAHYAGLYALAQERYAFWEGQRRD
jgi:hypothetical protein